MKLDPTRFSQGDFINASYTITVEAGTTLDDVLKPEFLANVSNKLRPYDRVHVRIDTGEWYAECLVLSAGRVWAKLMPMLVLDLTTQDVEITQGEAADEYQVAFRGPHLKFCIIRKSDREVIKEQIPTKIEAQNWLASYSLTR
jgi:hypothetical protein